MKGRIAISTVAAFLIGLMLGPPDPLTQLVLGVEAAFLCAVPLLILARRDFMKSASRQVHTLVCVLVCIAALLTVECHRFVLEVSSQERLIENLYEQLDQVRPVAPDDASDAGRL